MKIALLCQEEPVLLGPFLQSVIRTRPDAVCAVFVAGRRGAGEKSKTFAQKLEAQRIFWNLLEPPGYLLAAFLKLRAALLGRRDPRSVARLARAHGIPVHEVDDPNGAVFGDLLRRTAPDLVLNQSELLLKTEVLSIPRLGFINRHASLLPHSRGRLAGFWSHAAEPPQYGVTIHKVDVGLDTGDILVQERISGVDPRASYLQVMSALMARAPAMLWQAVDRLADADFTPQPQQPSDEPAHRFPTLDQVRHYRQVLRNRRTGRSGHGAHG